MFFPLSYSSNYYGTCSAWVSDFSTGQYGGWEYVRDSDAFNFSAIEVRSGKVAAAPEHITIALPGISLVGLTGEVVRRKLKKNKQ